jgi:hypothetical protein
MAKTAIVLASLTPFTGNSVTAERLAGYCSRLGWEPVLVDVHGGESALREAVLAGAAGQVVVIGIHAYRAGELTLKLDRSVPSIIVLSGACV